MSVYPAPTTAQPYGQTYAQGMPPPMQMAAPPPVQWVPSPSGRQGCPVGLEHLVDSAGISIIQDPNMQFNPMTGGVGLGPNRYSVRNQAGQQMYFVSETQSGMQYDPRRLIELSILDSNNRLCMMLRRHPITNTCFCCNCCCEDTFSRMEVLGGDGKLLGFAKHVYGGCNYKFEQLDASKKHIMTAETDNCRNQNTLNYIFDVTAGSNNIGSIQRIFMGFQLQSFSSDNFAVRFPQDLDVTAKALLLATTLLIDYVYFEAHANYRSRYSYR